MEPRSRRFSRRSVLGAAAGAAALPLLARAHEGHDHGTPAASPAASPVADGEWSFTDDRGVTVTLPSRPQRIVVDVNAGAPLWDFGIRPIAVTGWTVTSDPSWGNMDRSIPVINADDALPDPDLEQLVDLQPDLFVSITWSPDVPDELWSFSEPEAYQRTSEIVPIVAIAATGMADANMERFAELAALLGADLASPELVQAQADYDAAVSAFQTLAAEKADIVSLFAYVGTDPEWYAAYPPDWADLAWYQSLGLNMVVPEAAAGDFWQTLSFEEALRYPSDVLFNSTRLGNFTAEDFAEHPTFSAHPAIAAGQFGGWNQDFIMSYQGLTAALTDVTNVLAAAEKVI